MSSVGAARGREYKSREAYIYASSRIRVAEKRLLTSQQLQQLFAAQDYQEALRLFRETPYGVSLSRAPEELSYDEALRMETRRLSRELAEAAPGSPLLGLFTLEDEFHNLKILLKQQVLGKDFSQLLVEVPGQNLLYLRKLVEQPERNPRESLQEKALSEALKELDQTADLQRGEFVLDRALFAAELELARQLDSPLIENWVRTRIDLQNLGTALRLRLSGGSEERFSLAFIPGGELAKVTLLPLVSELGDEELGGESFTRRLPFHEPLLSAVVSALSKRGPARLEKARDEATLRAAREALKITYGPEVLFGYALSRQMEILNLRILLVSLQSGGKAEVRDNRLRVAGR